MLDTFYYGFSGLAPILSSWKRLDLLVYIQHRWAGRFSERDEAPQTALGNNDLVSSIHDLPLSTPAETLFSHSHGHTRATLSHYQIACIDSALALYQERTWRSTVQ
jgi:hypothetical protein